MGYLYDDAQLRLRPSAKLMHASHVKHSHYDGVASPHKNSAPWRSISIVA